MSASSATAAVSPSATSRASPIAYSRSPASSPRSASAARPRAAYRSAADSPRRSPRPAARTPRGCAAGARAAVRRRSRGRRLSRCAVDADAARRASRISPPCSRSSARSRSSALCVCGGASARSSPACRLCDSARERGGGGLERAFDLLGGVGKRGKPRLELRRRRIHAAREQLAAPGGVGVEVARTARRRSRPRDAR